MSDKWAVLRASSRNVGSKRWACYRPLATAIALSTGLTTFIVATTSSPTSAEASSELYGWGYNPFGAVGNGTTTNASTPTQVELPSGVTATSVAGGVWFSLAVGSNGVLYAWGENGDGELGDGTTNSSVTPVAVSLPAGVTPVEVAAGEANSAVLGSNGEVYTFGYNGFGQLGNGTTTNSDSPVEAELPAGIEATSISAGANFVAALTSAGTVYMWGAGGEGDLCQDGTFGAKTPREANNARDITAIAAGGGDILMLRSDGGIEACGANQDGQLGDGTTNQSEEPKLCDMPSGVSAVAIAAGESQSMMIGNNGEVYDWGNNANGELGNDSTTNSEVPVEAEMPSGVTATAVTAGEGSSYAVGSDGNIYAWGYNGMDELGNGTTTDSWTPTEVSMPSGANPATIVGSGVSADQAFVVAQATPAPTATTLTTSPLSATYGQTVTVTATVHPTDGSGSVSFKNGGSTISGCSSRALSLVSGSYQASCSIDYPVGSYSLSASYSGDSLYAASTSSAQDLIVDAAPLTITASSPAVTYGSSPPAITASYSGFENGDNASSLSVQPSCSTSASSSSPAGNYASSCSGASDSNYDISYVAGSVAINAAPLTITASSPAITYGATPPSITPSYSGFVNSDTASSLSSQPSCSTSATSSSSVGSYSSSCSGASDSNYDISYVAGSVAVDPAPLTITAQAASMTYGSASPTINAIYAGFVNGDDASALTTAPTCTTTATSSSAVGSYSASCSGAVDSNYTISYDNSTVTVNPAPLSITASSATMTYGTDPPTVTPEISGLENGDSAAALGDNVTCISAAGSTSSVGSYATACSGAIDANYQINYYFGTITVVGPGWAYGSLGNLFAPGTSVRVSSLSCVSSSDCWAVGATSSSSSATSALALSWDGSWWSVSTLPSLGSSSELTSVSCVSTSDCWAVGLTGVDDPGGGEQVVSLNWDGSSWSEVSTPNPADGTVEFDGTPAISCADSTDCWIVGSFGSGDPLDFAIEWDGTSWSLGSVPAATSPYDSTLLSSIDCTSASACWAVGTESASDGEVSPRAFAAEWNGTSWSAVTTPDASGLDSVSCSSASACWAVGPGTTTSTSAVLLSWNGSSWSSVSLPDVTDLDAVSCGSASNCWAVGTDQTSLFDTQAVGFQWNGSAWLGETLPQPLAVASPLAIACAGADCWSSAQATGSSTSADDLEYTDGDPGTPALPGGGVPLAAQGGPLSTDSFGGGSSLEAGSGAASQGVVDPVDPATGDNSTTATDLSVAGAGIPLAFTRTYDAQAAQADVTDDLAPGPLGYGWYDNLGWSLSYDSSPQVATVTEGNGSQDSFAAYSSSSSPSWCTDAANFCPSAPRTIATLNHNSDGSWTLVNDVSSPLTYTFSSAGALTEIADAQGDTLSAASGTPGSGQCPDSASSCTVWTSSASSELSLTLAFDSSGQLVQVEDWASEGTAGAIASFCFYGQSCASGAPSGGGGSDDLYSVTDPGSLTSTYSYDASNATARLDHDVLTVSVPGTGEIENSYNSSGQVAEQENLGGGAVTTYGYAGSPLTLDGGTTTVTSYPEGTASGEPYQQDVDTYSNGMLLSDTTTSSSSAAQSTELVARDPVTLLPTDVEDADGDISTEALNSYDNGGSLATSANVKVSTDPLGNTTEYAYNLNNQAWCTVDPANYLNGTRCPDSAPETPPSRGGSDPDLGMTISFYNSADELVATTDPLGDTTTYAYTSGVSGVPNGLMYCSVDPVSYEAGVACPAYGAAHVTGTTTKTFDASGNVLTSTDADGDTTTNVYDVAGYPGLVSSTTDPDGTATNYTYNSAGQVTEQVVSFNSYSATTEYAYDTSGLKYCEVDPDSYAQGVRCPTSPPSPVDPPLGVTSTFYNSAGQVIQTTNAIGGTTIYAYDGNGNKYCEVDPNAYAAGVRCPTSPPSGSAIPTPAVDGYLGTTIDTYNALGQLVQETSPIGGITLYSYDSAGNKTQQVVESNDPAVDPSVTTDYSYNADNQVIQTTVDPGSPLAETTLQSYDPDGNAYCSVSANAYAEGPSAYQCPTWQTSWITSPPSPISLYSATPSSNQANNVTITFSNADGDQLQSTNPDVETTVDAYDGDGRNYCNADATNVANWLSSNTSGSYPYLCPSTAPTSAPTGETTGYTTTIFDPAGKTLSSTDQVGDTTSYTYDPAGDKLTMVDPRGETTTYCYYWEDGSGQCAASAPSAGGTADDQYSMTTPPTASGPDGEPTTTTYNPSGKTATTTTPAGMTTDTYDANGDLVSEDYSDTATGYTTPPDVSYTYNPDGTRATMSDGTGTTTYSYDLAGDLTGEFLAAGTGTGLTSEGASYGYFSSGTLETMAYPSYGSYVDPTVTYSYDATGQMTAETDWLGNTVTFAHDADGNETAQDDVVNSANPSGTSSTTFSYDAADNNTSASSTAGQVCSSSDETLVQSFSGSTGSRNADGQLTSASDYYEGSCSEQVPYDVNYSYDPAGRVVYQGETAQGSNPNNFAYDAAGDPMTISSHDQEGNFDTYTQTFDPSGEVTAQTPVSGSGGSSSTYTYDTLGDMTSSTSGSTLSNYDYNQLGQMVFASVGTPSTTYTYNGDGLVASSKPSSAPEPGQYLWNSASDLETILSDGSNDYIYGPTDEPVEQVQLSTDLGPENPEFMTYSSSDSTWLMTNASGLELAFWGYDAYGTLAFGSPASAFGFTGQYLDVSTEFYDMRARWYDPATTGFISRDPAFDQTDQAYGYAGDDPVNRSDPSGRLGTTLKQTCGKVASAGPHKSRGEWCVSVYEDGAWEFQADATAESFGGNLLDFGVIDLVLNGCGTANPGCLIGEDALEWTGQKNVRVSGTTATIATQDFAVYSCEDAHFWADVDWPTLEWENGDIAYHKNWTQTKTTPYYDNDCPIA